MACMMSSLDSLSQYTSKRGPGLMGLLRDSLEEYHQLFNPVTVSYRKNSRLGLFQSHDAPHIKQLSVIYEPSLNEKLSAKSVPNDSSTTSRLLADHQTSLSSGLVLAEDQKTTLALKYENQKRETLRNTLHAMGKAKDAKRQLTRANLESHRSADSKIKPIKEVSKNFKDSRFSVVSNESELTSTAKEAQSRKSLISNTIDGNSQKTDRRDSRAGPLQKRVSRSSIFSNETDNSYLNKKGGKLGFGLGASFGLGKYRRQKVSVELVAHPA